MHDFQTHILKEVIGSQYIQKPPFSFLYSFSGHSLYKLFNSAKPSKPIGSNNSSKFGGSHKIFLKELVFISQIIAEIYINTYIYTYINNKMLISAKLVRVSKTSIALVYTFSYM